jgi:diaminohydroxyphosphoribosylaminopyrimidine deaminase/5-amino-6-(5-phosphoribosylamino)uracil reductase
VPGKGRRVAVPKLLRRLAENGVTSLIVEGGSETLWEFFRAGCVDAVAVFVAPRILGGSSAPGGVGGLGFGLAQSPALRDLAWESVGPDLLLTAKVS